MTDGGCAVAGWGWGCGGVGGGAGRGGDACASSAAFARLCVCSSGPGACASTAQASRCRRVATCESQHDTEQNTSLVRLRLQVDTLQTQWTAWKAMLVLQALHSIQTSAGGWSMGRIVVPTPSAGYDAPIAFRPNGPFTPTSI